MRSLRPGKVDQGRIGARIGDSWNLCSVPEQERVFDDLGLLLEPVALEPLSGLKIIRIAAERQPAQHQVDTNLMLPDMRHFMDEYSLALQ